MAENLVDGDLRLPAEFLGNGFFLEERCAANLMAEIGMGSDFVQQKPRLSSPNTVMETESDEEDYIAGLTRQMAHSFLEEENTSSFWDTRVLTTTPQSTMGDAGIWAASCRGSPNGASKVSSPFSTSLEQRKDDALDLLYVAAGEVLRKKQNANRTHEGRLLNQLKKPLVHTKSSTAAEFYNQQVLARQQLQAAQFYKLKQQQLIKNQLSSAWSRQNRAAAEMSNRPHGLAPSAWSPMQRKQPSNGMTAIFLNGPGARRESAGTGVFLPRRAGSTTDNRKKPACSTVLLPARVLQALNLTLDDAGLHSRCPIYVSCDHEMASARGKPGHNELKRNIYQHPPATISGHEMRLPKEWTY